MSTRERRQRLDALSQEHVVYIHYVPFKEPCAVDPCGYFTWLEPREFGVAAVSQDPVSSDEAYLVALHEIGHAVVQRRGKRLSHLAEEAAAWRWAIENAGFDLSPAQWAWLVQILRNDLDNYAGEHYALMKEAENGASS